MSKVEVMKKYIGTKEVSAIPCTAKAAEVTLGRTVDTKNADAEGNGYLVEYKDGYTSWSPKAAFEEAYVELGKVKKGPKEKDMGISDVKGAKANISDLVVYGDGDTFALLCKASSQEQGWMKSTKVCNVPGGCIVQVTTQQKNLDCTYAVAEALTFVPGVVIDTTCDPRRLIADPSIVRF